MVQPKRRRDDDGAAELTESEIAQKRDAAVRRAMKTPPKPHKDMKKGKLKTKPSASDKKAP